jgi:hypothetical protein
MHFWLAKSSDETTTIIHFMYLLLLVAKSQITEMTLEIKE